jgi:serine/threonine protein kinase
LKAIKLLHSNKILHGDIHSGNIVLGTDNLPRLIDFDKGIVDAPPELIELEKKYVRTISPSFSQYRDFPAYWNIHLARELYLDVTP